MPLAVRLFRDDRRCLLVVLFLALFLFALRLGGRDLWAPDEPRTGVIVRAIVQDGDWAVLRDNGRPYVEKPPLYFWLAALAAFAFGGVDEFTLRLPASVAALGGIVVVFYLGRNLFGRRTGALAAIVLATTQNYFMEARWAHPDMVWTTLLLLACMAFQRAHAQGGGVRRLLVFYLAMGGAVLAKGPLGILLPPLAVVTFLAATRDLAFLKRSGWVWGLPLSLLPAGLWLLAWNLSAGAPFPLRDALGRLAQRFTQGVHHPRPFLHLFTSLPVEFLPWTVLLPGALLFTLPRRGGRVDRENAWLYSWIFVLLAIFGLSAEKRGVYLLPLLPLLALLVARVWDAALFDWDPSPVARTIRGGLLGGAVLGAASLAWALARLRREAADLVPPAALLGGMVLLTAVTALVVQSRRGGGAALGAVAAGLAACYTVVTVAVFPALDGYKSARPFCARVARLVGEAPLCIYPHYRSAYAYYAGRTLATPHDRDALRDFLAAPEPAYCLVEEGRMERDRAALGLVLDTLDRERIGHRSMLLVAARRGPAPAAAGVLP